MKSSRFLSTVKRKIIKAKRVFSSSSITKGIYSDYVAKLSPSVKQISTDELKNIFEKDQVNGPHKHFHLLDVRFDFN
jgi:hypothetical protein